MPVERKAINRRQKRMAALGDIHPQQTGLDHKHVGSPHAADAAMAIENARDVYTRRQKASASGGGKQIHHGFPIPKKRENFASRRWTRSIVIPHFINYPTR